MNDYVILVGLGEVGINIFREFFIVENDVELTAIDNSYNRVNEVNDYVKSKNPQSVDLCVYGDPLDHNVLINVGLKRCNKLILALCNRLLKIYGNLMPYCLLTKSAHFGYKSKLYNLIMIF